MNANKELDKESEILEDMIQKGYITPENASLKQSEKFTELYKNKNKDILDK